MMLFWPYLCTKSLNLIYQRYSAVLFTKITGSENLKGDVVRKRTSMGENVFPYSVPMAV